MTMMRAVVTNRARDTPPVTPAVGMGGMEGQEYQSTVAGRAIAVAASGLWCSGVPMWVNFVPVDALGPRLASGGVGG